MRKRLIITLTAANRAGILAAVATALAELGGELREVKQTLLDRYFTMILSADFPEHRDTGVIFDHLRGMCERFDIRITINEPIDAADSSEGDAELSRHRLTLTGQDRPGLLAELAVRIARDEIDIVEMRARRAVDDRAFEMKLELTVPAGVDVSLLTTDLEEIGRDIGLLAWIEESHPNDEPIETPTRIR